MKVSEFTAYSKPKREIIRQADVLWWAVKKLYKPYGELNKVELFVDDGDFTVKVFCSEEPEDEDGGKTS